MLGSLIWLFTMLFYGINCLIFFLPYSHVSLLTNWEAFCNHHGFNIHFVTFIHQWNCFLYKRGKKKKKKKKERKKWFLIYPLERFFYSIFWLGSYTCRITSFYYFTLSMKWSCFLYQKKKKKKTQKRKQKEMVAYLKIKENTLFFFWFVSFRSPIVPLFSYASGLPWRSSLKK